MPQKKSAGKHKPIRFRQARVDGSVKTLKKTIEEKFGLPKGSVQIVKRGGKKIRGDATVESLLDSWD
jgi:hypothetical protein